MKVEPENHNFRTHENAVCLFIVMFTQHLNYCNFLKFWVSESVQYQKYQNLLQLHSV